MSIDASAKNMQAVCKAKEHHDKTCPWRGTGTEVHLNWFDIERMGWEEGDVICGLVVVDEHDGLRAGNEQRAGGGHPEIARRQRRHRDPRHAPRAEPQREGGDLE